MHADLLRVMVPSMIMLAFGVGCTQPSPYGASRTSGALAAARGSNFHALGHGYELTAAMAADKAGDYDEAIRLYKQIDAGGEDQEGNRAAAEERIGEHYEKGLGVPQDNRAAASWYEKAVDQSNGRKSSTRAAVRLGYIYANGRGVPKDRARARELFTSVGPSGSAFVAMLDHDLLPQDMEEALTPSARQSLKARMDEQAARATAEKAKATAEEAKAAAEEAEAALRFLARLLATQPTQQQNVAANRQTCINHCRSEYESCAGHFATSAWDVAPDPDSPFASFPCGNRYSFCKNGCPLR